MVLFKITNIFHDSPRYQPNALSFMMIFPYPALKPILQENEKHVHRQINWDKEKVQ